MEIRYVSEQELRLLEADKDQYAAVIDVLEELGYKCDDSSSYNTGDFSLNKFFPIWQGSNGIYNITVEFLRVPVFSDTSGIPSRSYTCVLIKYRLEEDQ